MLTKRRNITIAICIALIIAGGVFEAAQWKPHVKIPQSTEVSSVQIIFNTTNPNPKPILTNSTQGRADITQLLKWLKSAKSMGYVQNLAFRMSMGPTEVAIKLNNHKEIDISQAWLPATTTQPDGRVIHVLKRSNDYVDIQPSDTSKWIQYYSPQLASWLNVGWKN